MGIISIPGRRTYRTVIPIMTSALAIQYLSGCFNFLSSIQNSYVLIGTLLVCVSTLSWNDLSRRTLSCSDRVYSQAATLPSRYYTIFSFTLSQTSLALCITERLFCHGHIILSVGISRLQFVACMRSMGRSCAFRLRSCPSQTLLLGSIFMQLRMEKRTPSTTNSTAHCLSMDCCRKSLLILTKNRIES